MPEDTSSEKAKRNFSTFAAGDNADVSEATRKSAKGAEKAAVAIVVAKDNPSDNEKQVAGKVIPSQYFELETRMEGVPDQLRGLMFALVEARGELFSSQFEKKFTEWQQEEFQNATQNSELFKNFDESAKSSITQVFLRETAKMVAPTVEVSKTVFQRLYNTIGTFEILPQQTSTDVIERFMKEVESTTDSALYIISTYVYPPKFADTLLVTTMQRALLMARVIRALTDAETAMKEATTIQDVWTQWTNVAPLLRELAPFSDFDEERVVKTEARVIETLVVQTRAKDPSAYKLFAPSLKNSNLARTAQNLEWGEETKPKWIAVEAMGYQRTSSEIEEHAFSFA